LTGSRPTSSGAVGLELAVVDADGEAWEVGWGEPAPEGSETAGVSLLVALAAGRLAPRRARATRAFVANGAKGPVEVAEGAVMALTRAEPGAAWWAGTLEGDGGDQLEFLAQVVEPIETAVAFDPELAAGRRGRHSVVELDELVDDRDGRGHEQLEAEVAVSVEQLAEAWLAADADGSGELDVGELGAVLKSLGRSARRAPQTEGVKGVFDPPEYLLTSFRTVLVGGIRRSPTDFTIVLTPLTP
jgi:hypothetical protein